MDQLEHSILLPNNSKTGSRPWKMGLTDLTVSVPGSQARPGQEPAPQRWTTTEFRFYAIAFILVVPMMLWVPMRVSLPTHPNYPLYSYKLSPGWMFGRQVDNSDIQYRTFRSNLLPLLILASSYLIASFVHFRALSGIISRPRFIAISSIAVTILLHGSSSAKVLAILALNYYASKFPLTPAMRKVWPGVIFCGNMAVLFFNERYSGYKFSSLHADLGVLDDYSGLLPRWHVGFNITMMRLVSFGLDYIWRVEPAEAEAPIEYRKRAGTSLPEKDYSFTNCLAYCLYPPLYVAGPIMSFNDFAWQLKRPVEITPRTKIAYAFRFLVCILTMELVLHTMYVVAIKDTAAWDGDTPAELSMIGFWNLVIVWLKLSCRPGLLIPWRFFRLWALWDGVDPPENMVRCISNNYSALGFWRSWHRSFNLWVVRYVYIPVGGSKNVVPATLLVFTFVALWHDLSFKLLAWGWLVSLFIVPEIAARKLFTAEKFGEHRYYRHVCALGGVANILMMMAANLVGFVLGVDGTRHLLKELTSTFSGWTFLLFACGCLFVGVQAMFEYREEEKREGIDRRC
ncbi:glycerol transporter [Cryptococcus wingfieldii CBS 7118]|uniref:Glycerol transporter n=1 Tax=Cryptococcus wingfieldii CBS 7118 TaxID=1295528 RepID=A0A1E3J8Y9_9TREE|nr:glycerol transporter [Cryptococcus wingfieldii CBS 7118]ODN97333.1 glycerol transporter [Cryptococcus wingfieldii CBS 7118]